MKKLHTLFAFLTVTWLLLVADLAIASGPVTVSPGDLREAVLINETCPTFSWTSIDGAEAYELLAWLLPMDAEASSEPEVVIEETLPRGALGWTPSLGQCLTHGRRYAWAVRAIGGEGGEEWSEPALFAVTAGPTERELQEALAIVRRYAEAAGAPARPDPEAGVSPSVPAEPSRRSSARKVDMKALSTAPAAFHAEPSATVGEVVGVRGVVNSSGGAAGVFNNTAGGKILSGLSSGVEVVTVNSSGNVSATSFSGDGASLTNVTANGLSCSSCVSSSDVLNGSLTASDLGPNSVGSSEIQSGAVGSSEVISSQVQLRVTGSCPAGSSIGLINSNGTVICEPDDIKGWERVSYTSTCANAFNCWAWVGCNSGKRVLGGGVELPGLDVGLWHLVTMSYSRPRDDVSWEVGIANDIGSTLTFKVWAVCSPAVN